MSESNENTINTNDSNITAQGNVEFVGGNQYKIGGNVFNVDISKPAYGTNIDQLQNSLKLNRFTLKEDLEELEEKIRDGDKIDDGGVQALIKDIITEGRNIEMLVSAIKLGGGQAKSLPDESNTLKIVNRAILRGKRESQSNELERCQNLLNEAKINLKNASKWKLFRTKAEREKEISSFEWKVKYYGDQVVELSKIISAIDSLG